MLSTSLGVGRDWCLGTGWASRSGYCAIALCIAHFVYSFTNIIVIIFLFLCSSIKLSLSQPTSFTSFFPFSSPSHQGGRSEPAATWYLVASWGRTTTAPTLLPKSSPNWSSTISKTHPSLLSITAAEVTGRLLTEVHQPHPPYPSKEYPTCSPPSVYPVPIISLNQTLPPCPRAHRSLLPTHLLHDKVAIRAAEGQGHPVQVPSWTSPKRFVTRNHPDGDRPPLRPTLQSGSCGSGWSRTSYLFSWCPRESP